MPNRVIYEGENENCLEVFINKNKMIYLAIGHTRDDRNNFEYIELDVEDAVSLRDQLSDYIDKLK